MLSQLVYVSTRKNACSALEIENILFSLKKSNAQADATGVLLYSNDKFIQYLEGESAELLKLYEQISQDKGHAQVRMIAYGPIQEKAFPSWQMATKKLSGEGLALRWDMSVEDKKTFKQLLNGEAQPNAKVLVLLKKFFS